MKVFIVTKEPFPNGMAASNRIKCYARGIMRNGINCQIIISKRTEKYGILPKNLEYSGIIDNIPFLYIGKSTLRNKSLIIRNIYDFVDSIKTLHFLYIRANKNDIIFNYLREDNLNILIGLISKIKGFKTYRELCEYPYGASNNNYLVKIKRKIQLHLIFKIFDGFIAISENLKNLAEQYKTAKAKVLKVPIMINYNDVAYDKSMVPPTNLPFIFHSGTLYEQKDGIIGAIEAFGIYKQKNNDSLIYILTGNLEQSPEKREIELLITKYNIKKYIYFTGYITQKVLNWYTNNATLMIINKLDNLQNRYCFATKLGEYLLSGNPVITTNIGEANMYLKDKVTALIVSPGFPELIEECIEYIITHPKESKMIGENGKKMALLEFSELKQGKNIKKFLENQHNHSFI